MKIGDIVKFKDLEWYVIDNNPVRLLLKNSMEEERIKKYVDDEWYRNGKCVRHCENVRPPFDWEKSYIKNVVLSNFKKDLDIECEVDLLTKKEVENLPEEIRCCDEWYWTKTNASDENDSFAYAGYVDYDGFLYYSSVNRNIAVRPAVSLVTNIEIIDGEGTEESPYILGDKEETMNCQTKKNRGKNPFADLEELPMIYSGNAEDEIMRNRYIINEIIKTLKEQ